MSDSVEDTTWEFRCRVPATSANLGPAFDAAGLALDLWMTLRARRAAADAITATGRDEAICGGAPEQHLILAVYRATLARYGKPAPTLELAIENEIPIGKGCGSSAAARLAGLALANHFGRLHWNTARIIAEATLLEGHPDNVAPCWLGGLVVSRADAEDVHAAQQSAATASIAAQSAAPVVDTVRFQLARPWKLLVAVPEQELATEEARKVLPASYTRADAVANVQNAMLLLASLACGRQELLARALGDRLHQPYRAALCPLLPALAPLAVNAEWPEVLGVALSGAGPSVLVWLDEETQEAALCDRLAGYLAGKNLTAELLVTRAAAEGGAAFTGAMPLPRPHSASQDASAPISEGKNA